MSKRIRRSAYDVLYDHDWNQGGITVWNGGGFKNGTSFEDIMGFAQFMSKALGFRLRVTFIPGGLTVSFNRMADNDY